MYVPIADDDIPAIVTLMNRAYRDESGAGWNSEAAYIDGDRTTQALLRAELTDKPSGFFLKWLDADDGIIRGCVWLEPLGGAIWYLGSLAVHPDDQNGGRGRTILAAAEDWARARGAARIRISVINVREGLIAWYLRRGYESTGKTEPFLYGDDRFGRPLRDDLCFVILEKSLEAATSG